MSGNRRVAKPPLIDTNIPTNEQWYTHHISGTPRPTVNFRHRYAIDAVGITNLAHSPAGHGTGDKQGVWATVVTTDNSLGGQPQVRLAFRQQPGSAASHSTGWQVHTDPLLHLEPDVNGTLVWIQTDLASQRNGDYVYATTQSNRVVSPSIGGRWSDWQPGFTKTFEAAYQGRTDNYGGGWRAVIDGTATEVHQYSADTGVGEIPYGGQDPNTIPFDSRGYATIQPYTESTIVDLGAQALADARAQIPLSATTTRYGASYYSSLLVAYREGYITDRGLLGGSRLTNYSFTGYANATLVQNYALYKAAPGGYSNSGGWNPDDPTDLTNVRPYDMDPMTLNQDYAVPPDGGTPWQWETPHATIRWEDIHTYAIPDFEDIAAGNGAYVNNAFTNAFPPGTVHIDHSLYVSWTKNLPALNPEVLDTYAPRIPWLDTSDMTLIQSFSGPNAVMEQTPLGNDPASTEFFGYIDYPGISPQPVTIPLSSVVPTNARQVMFALEPDLARTSAKDHAAFFEIEPMRPYRALTTTTYPVLGAYDYPFESELFPYAAPGFASNIDPENFSLYNYYGTDQLFHPYFGSVPVKYTIIFPRWRYWMPYDVIPGHWSDWIDWPNPEFTTDAVLDKSYTQTADFNTVGGPSIQYVEQECWAQATTALTQFGFAYPPSPKASWYLASNIDPDGENDAVAGSDREQVRYLPSGDALNQGIDRYDASLYPALQGLHSGVDYIPIPGRGGQVVELEQDQNQILGLEVTSDLQIENGLIYSNDYQYPNNPDGTPNQSFAWPSPPTDCTFNLKASFRKNNLTQNSVTSSFAYDTGSSTGDSNFPRTSPFINYPDVAASTNLYYQHSLTLPSGVQDCDEIRVTVKADPPTMTQFPDMTSPTPQPESFRGAFYQIYGGAVAESLHVVAHYRKPRYRYWVPRITGPNVGSRTEMRMKIVRIGPDHSVETRFDHASRDDLLGNYAQSNQGRSNLYHGMFVSDDETPFIWQNYGDISGLYGTFLTDQHADYCGVGYWGFPDDGTGQTGGYVNSDGYSFGHTGAYFQAIFLPDNLFGFGPVLVHPWRAGDHGSPELWYFVMNGNGQDATYDIYTAQWGRGNFRRPPGRLATLADDPDYNNRTRRYPTRNPDGYAFDSNWYRPANLYGRIGPFPNLKVWNRMTSQREDDSIVFPVFKVLRDPKRLGQNHVTVVNGGPLGGQV